MKSYHQETFSRANFSNELLRIFAFAFDQIDTMAGIIDKNGTIFFANQASLRVIGCKLDQMVGTPFRDSPWRNHSDEAKKLTDIVIKEACEGKKQITEDFVKAPDGQLVPAIFSMTPIRDENGEIIALAPEGKDISELKRLQAKLENQQWEIQKWIDSMGSFVAKCTPDGEIISCNQPFWASRQIPLESIHGKHICSLTRLKKNRNNQKKIRKVLFNARDGIQSSVEINFSIDQGNDCTDLFSANPVLDSSGKIAFLTIEITDISEQVRMRELTLNREKEYSKHLKKEGIIIKSKLEKTEQFYKNLIDANPAGVMLLNHNGCVVILNPKMEQYFENVGIPKNLIKGKRLSQLKMYTADQFWRKNINQYRSESLFGQQRMILSDNDNDNDNVYFLEVLFGPLKFPDSGVMGNIVVVNDRTERIKLETELLNARVLAEKMNSMGLFISGVAHEMNNPLTSILGCAEHLMENQNDDSQFYDAMNIIIKNTKRASEIVQKLLSLTYTQNSNQTTIDLNDTIKYVVGLYIDQSGKKGIQLTLNLSDKINMIIGDPVQLQQVIANFCQNGIDAIEESDIGDEIIFRTFNQEEWVIVEIEDNGPGIPKEHRSQLFDPFFTTKPPGKGTGLGLSINYNVIRGSGGFISVTDASNSGTRFIVKILSAKVHQVEHSRIDKPFLKYMPSEVLIIDSEKTLRVSLSNNLEELGCVVDTVMSGLPMIEALKKKKYDLVLIDLKVLMTDTGDIYQYLMTKRSKLAQKIVFMSSCSAMEIKASSAFPYIPILNKPFSLKDLFILL